MCQTAIRRFCFVLLTLLVSELTSSAGSHTVLDAVVNCGKFYENRRQVCSVFNLVLFFSLLFRCFINMSIAMVKDLKIVRVFAVMCFVQIFPPL